MPKIGVYVKWYKHYNYVCLATIISENKANKKT
jgi:hypothetical protein